MDINSFDNLNDLFYTNLQGINKLKRQFYCRN